MWSLFQSSVNPSVRSPLIAVRQGKSGMRAVIFPATSLNFQRCFQASREILCPGSAPGFLPVLSSRESLHDAQEQHFDSKVLAGHWAFHTFMSESPYGKKKKKEKLILSSCITNLILFLPAPTLWPNTSMHSVTNLKMTIVTAPNPMVLFTWFMTHELLSNEAEGTIFFAPCVTVSSTSCLVSILCN